MTARKLGSSSGDKSGMAIHDDVSQSAVDMYVFARRGIGEILYNSSIIFGRRVTQGCVYVDGMNEKVAIYESSVCLTFF